MRRSKERPKLEIYLTSSLSSSEGAEASISACELLPALSAETRRFSSNRGDESRRSGSDEEEEEVFSMDIVASSANTAAAAAAAAVGDAAGGDAGSRRKEIFFFGFAAAAGDVVVAPLCLKMLLRTSFSPLFAFCFASLGVVCFGCPFLLTWQPVTPDTLEMAANCCSWCRSWSCCVRCSLLIFAAVDVVGKASPGKGGEGEAGRTRI